MIPNRQIQWTEAMSRERFVQEAMLLAMEIILSHTLDAFPLAPISEGHAERMAAEAREIAYALDEAFGNPNIPRLEGKA